MALFLMGVALPLIFGPITFFILISNYSVPNRSEDSNFYFFLGACVATTTQWWLLISWMLDILERLHKIV